jgi:hypothetical protein
MDNWNKIERDFVEWDNSTHSNASQRQILDWFKERFKSESKLIAKLEEVVISIKKEREYLSKWMLTARSTEESFEYLFLTKETLKLESEIATLNISHLSEMLYEYHEAKPKEITDADIEAYLNEYKVDDSILRKAMKLGAIAMRDNIIKHI